MIREAHDYRVGLFDRHCRKLTGRSYSAMPNAVVRDFPPETMRPGDVFLMNDTYLTEGSIGHLPDLCSTVPVFHDGEVVAYHPGLRPPRRHRRTGAGLDAGHRHHRVRGRPGGAADQALRRRPAQRGGVHHHQAQHPRARDARRRSRQRGAGLRDGRAPDGGAVRALRTRDGRSLLPGHPRQVPRHLPQRAAAEDRRRRICLAGLCRARRRQRSQAAQARAQDDQARRAHHARLHRHRSAIDRPDQLAGGLCGRRLPDQMDRADPAQPRRHAGARRRDPRQRRRVRGVRRGVPAQGHVDHAANGRRRPMRARSCCCAASGCWPAWSRRRSTAACRRIRRPSATPASSATTPTASRFFRARCSAAAPAGATTPTATTPSTSCRIRATSRPSSPRRAFRCWSRSSRCARIPAAPASGAAASATRSTIARWSIAAPSSPPTGCGSAATASTAARPGSRSASRVDVEGQRRATSAAWSTASRCSQGRWCAW